MIETLCHHWLLLVLALFFAAAFVAWIWYEADHAPMDPEDQWRGPEIECVWDESAQAYAPKESSPAADGSSHLPKSGTAHPTTTNPAQGMTSGNLPGCLGGPLSRKP